MQLLLFEPNRGGHHPEYVCHVLRAWPRAGGGRLVAVVAQGLLEQQAALAGSLLDSANVAIESIPPPFVDELPTLWRKNALNRTLLRDAILRHRPAHVLVMYLDHLQMALATGLRFPFPVTISGILFRPTLHYPLDQRFGLAERARRWRKRLLLAAMARNPHLGTVFSLDPFAVPHLRGLGLDAVALADPVDAGAGRGDEIAAWRERSRAGDGRRVLGLFGVLHPRKGTLHALEAVAGLEPAEARRISLLLGGPVPEEFRAVTEARIDAARTAGAHVVADFRYLPADAIQTMVGACDLVLAPYPRHVGSSALLVRAAAAGLPVLAQDWGLIGMQVRRHALGRAVDTRDTAVVRAAIRDFLRDPATGFDPARARAFAAENTSLLFARTLLDRVGAPAARGEVHCV